MSERRDAVLALLEERRPGWVDGPELCTPDVGGSEGLRRVRELTDAGYRIDRERIPGRDSWRYRLVSSPDEANPDRVGPGRMVPNSQPGRPDRYVNLDRARAQAVDQGRKQEAEDRTRELLATPFRTTPLRIVFGQVICRGCSGTGGSALAGPCGLCAGSGLT